MTENEIIDLTNISPEVEDTPDSKPNDTSDILTKIINEHNGNIFNVDWAGLNKNYQ